MNMKKLLMATVSGFVVMFVLSWVGHELLIRDLFGSTPMESIERESPLYLGIGLAYLVLALLMAYIYPRGIEGTNVFGNGLRFGLLMGLVISLPISIILYSTLTTPTISRIVMEAVWHMIEQGAGGVALAYVYGIPGSEPVSESTGSASEASDAKGGEHEF